jgi:3-dehydroquinate dehydratase-2
MKIMVINGPSLNMLGIRETEIYGSGSYTELVEYIENSARQLDTEVVLLQSNHEGQIIDWIQQAYFEGFGGIIINPGAYSHTSIAIADAIRSVRPIPAVEVHISDTDAREDYRRISYTAPCCIAQIKGLGFEGYRIAMEKLLGI